MGLSGNKQQQQSNNTSTVSYGYQTPPETQDVRNLRNAKFTVDPGLHAQYGTLRKQLASGFNNPLGADYSPEVRDAMLRSGNERLGQQEAEAYRGGQFDVNRLNFMRDSSLAGMTAPVLAQTGGTSSGTGTVTQSTNPIGGILQGAASVAPMSM